MSSTSVRSREYHINCGATEADEKGKTKMPPETAISGPSTLDVKQGPALEIAAEKSELRESGELVAGGRTVATFPPEAYRQLDKKKDKNREADKGNDRE